MAVAGAVADINREVAEGDSQTTLQALQSPLAGLRGVLSECADTYQTQLSQRQDLNVTTGNLAYNLLYKSVYYSFVHLHCNRLKKHLWMFVLSSRHSHTIQDITLPTCLNV